jgi:hypothetical protein
MTFIWTSLALISLTVLGIVGFAWLIRDSKTINDTKSPDGLAQLLNRRQNNNRYKTPILFFGLFVSSLYAYFAFDATYNKIVEKKLYAQKPELVDSLIAYVVSAPPPPPSRPIVEEQEVIEEQVEVPEIKLVDKLKENKPTDVLDPVSPTLPGTGGVSGPPGPPGPPGSPDNNNQQVDTRLYFPKQLDKQAEFQGVLANYLFPISQNVNRPNSYRNQGKDYVITVSFVIEKDGSISDVTLPKNCEVELKPHEIQYIKDHLSKMPNWKPGLYLQKPVRSLLKLPITLTR